MPQINFHNFILKKSYFDNHSTRHGISHTYRVMFHVQNIGKRANLNHEIKLGWCAAFIHDMARKHDSYCVDHGEWAAESKLPVFMDLFHRENIDDKGIEAIRLAVSNHSVNEEIPREHPYYNTVALLKDADALDRIRISENNLEEKYLRFPESIQLVGFAKKLYYETADIEIKSYSSLLKIASKIRLEEGT